MTTPLSLENRARAWFVSWQEQELSSREKVIYFTALGALTGFVLAIPCTSLLLGLSSSKALVFIATATAGGTGYWFYQSARASIREALVEQFTNTLPELIHRIEALENRSPEGERPLIRSHPRAVRRACKALLNLTELGSSQELMSSELVFQLDRYLQELVRSLERVDQQQLFHSHPSYPIFLNIIANVRQLIELVKELEDYTEIVAVESTLQDGMHLLSQYLPNHR